MMTSSSREKTYYEILSLDKTASPDEIHKAYRRIALRLHPDHNSDSDAKEKFQRLVHIHAILSNAESRQVYDCNCGDTESLTQSKTEHISQDDIADYCTL